jgi:hypothetical protein
VKLPDVEVLARCWWIMQIRIFPLLHNPTANRCLVYANIIGNCLLRQAIEPQIPRLCLLRLLLLSLGFAQICLKGELSNRQQRHQLVNVARALAV